MKEFAESRILVVLSLMLASVVAFGSAWLELNPLGFALLFMPSMLLFVIAIYFEINIEDED